MATPAMAASGGFGGDGVLPQTPYFEFPAASLRVLQRAVNCVAKLGRDAALLLRAEELVLHGADDGHTTAMQFAFRRKFFRATPATTAGGAEYREASVVVSARTLLMALKGSQQRAESLVVSLSDAKDGEVRLVLDFAARFGITVRHRVPPLDTQLFLPGEPPASATPNIAAMAPKLLACVLEHCAPMTSRNAGCEEVTLTALPQEGLRVQTYDLLGSNGALAAQANRTEVLLQRSDLEVCQLDARGGEVTFSGRGLRDFARVLENNSRDLELLGAAEGAPVLEVRFGLDTTPGTIVCRFVAAEQGVTRPLQDFSAALLIATRDLGDPEGPFSAPGAAAPAATQASCAATQTTGRRPVPRQGPKRRALTAAEPGAFDVFPDANQGLTQASAQPTPAPTFGSFPRNLQAPTQAAAPAQAPPPLPRTSAPQPAAQSQHGTMPATAFPLPVTSHFATPAVLGVTTGSSPQPVTLQAQQHLQSQSVLQSQLLVQSEPPKQSVPTLPQQPLFTQHLTARAVGQASVGTSLPQHEQPAVALHRTLEFSAATMAQQPPPLEVAVPAASGHATLASSLYSNYALDVPDSDDDDDLIGADEDEVVMKQEHEDNEDGHQDRMLDKLMDDCW